MRVSWPTGIGILAAIGALGSIVTILQWMETSRWFPQWIQVVLTLPWTPIVWLVFLALILIGLSRVRTFEGKLKGIEQTQNKSGDDFAHVESEIRDIKGAINKVREDIDERIQRLGGHIDARLTEIETRHEARLSELEARVSRLERLPTTVRERRAAQAAEAYETEPYPMADGTIWTRPRLDALPERQRELLLQQHPDLERWYLS